MNNIILSILVNGTKKDFTYPYNNEKQQQYYNLQKEYYIKYKYKILQEVLENVEK